MNLFKSKSKLIKSKSKTKKSKIIQVDVVNIEGNLVRLAITENEFKKLVIRGNRYK